MKIVTELPSLFGADAMTVWPFIFVREQYANNIPLMAHENVHFQEQWKWCVIPWWIAYLLFKTFRMNAEVLAYKVQVSMGFPVATAAWLLANKYKLGISEKDAMTKLLG